MAKVCGTSEEARQLGSLLTTAMNAVESGVSNIEQGGNSIRSAWNDDGVAVIEELVSSIRSALQDAVESMPRLQEEIEAYAVLLEQQLHT
jgi:phage-related protein